jgi:hypothetical protein
VNREFGEIAASEAQGVELGPIPNDDVDIEDPQPAQLQPAPLTIYAYKSHFQPYRGWLGIFATSFFIVFNGWWVFVGRGGRFQADGFVSCYIAVSFHNCT